MNTYTLKYRKGTISFALPEKWVVHTLKPQEPESLPFEKTILYSLEHPIGEPPFSEWIKDFKNILIIVPDITRYAGTERILPVLFDRFLKERETKIVFALGNHRKHTIEEQRGIVSPMIYENVSCIDHDCYDTKNLSSFGFTSSGIEVLLNASLASADGVIVIGSINFHYLAGFGGGRKALFPGIAGYKTILGIHGRVFNKDKPGKHPCARSGVLEGNPMHEEIMEGIALVKKPMFLINTILDDKKNLLKVFSGHINSAHVEGCRWLMEHFACTPQEKADIVIAGAGGFPKDINFIQTHKTIEHAMGAIKEGGTMIVAGGCEDGIGNDDFLQWLEYKTIGEMEHHVRNADRVYAQTAYATRVKTQRCTIILISNLTEDVVRKMGLIPKKNMVDALALLDKEKRYICNIIPDGSTTLVI